jgi:DNA-binding PucR family transcriptional regulator
LISGSSAEAVRDVLAEHRLRAGVSPVFSDYAAAPHAVRLARATLASASKGQALVFGESLIGSLVAGNPELAEETETVLDPILQLKSEDETRVLLLTLRAWFEAGGSYERVASGMYVHRNTVRNRIRRLETLTDRSLVDPRQSAEILVALTALDQRANEQTSR